VSSAAGLTSTKK